MGEPFSKGRFGRPVDCAVVARDWAARGFSCDPFMDPPGRAWLEFVHDANELVTVVDGRLTLSVGDRHYTVEPGDEAFIPRGVRHSVRNSSDGTTRWLYGYD